MPVIAMIIGKPDFRELDFAINDAVFRYGAFITDVIQFLAIGAAVFFFIVKPINVLNERRRRGEEEAAPEELSDEAALLTEIRDLLSAQAGPGEQVPPRAGF
jgi:large conductance mechanosensitive channel